MKRDNLLVLNILSTIEQHPDAYVGADVLISSLTRVPAGVDREPWTRDQILGHLPLLEDAILIRVETSEEHFEPPLPRFDINEKYSILGIRLTWHGHEYLIKERP